MKTGLLAPFHLSSLIYFGLVSSTHTHIEDADKLYFEVSASVELFSPEIYSCQGSKHSNAVNHLILN